MAQRVYVITKSDGETIRIRASSFKQTHLGSGFWSLDFYEEGKQNASAEVSVALPYSVIPQDMIYASLRDSLIYPTISETDDEGVDFLGESFFSEAEKNLLHIRRTTSFRSYITVNKKGYPRKV